MIAPSSTLDFRRLFESAPGLYLVLAPDLRIVAASDAYLAATMTKREEILGRFLFDVFPDNPDDDGATGVGNLQASLDRVRRDLVPDSMAVQKYDIRRPQSEGGRFEVRYWSPRNYPLLADDGTLAYFIHRVEDVTEFVNLRASEAERAQVTDELRQRTQRMEAEILRRAQDLQIANAQLRAAGGFKDEFVSRMSHELRTPLNSVIGYAQVLSRETLTADQHESVVQILKAGHLLLGLINEVLDLSRIATGQLSLSLEPVSVMDSVTDAISLVGPMASARNVTVAVETTHDAYVVADRQRMKQTLLNLLSNAVKYNRSAGAVSLSWQPSGDRLHIRVSDTGIGIPDTMIGRLFEPFERLGAETTTVEGTGLGLALSKNLVEAMGGSLTAESTYGSGATFTIDLASTRPTELVDERGSAPEPRRGAPGPRRTVLYIEDNLANLRLVERMLASREEVVVMSALQGRLGIELARQHQPAMILLDLHLPDIGGAEVLEQLKSMPETRDIPVVVMSADATPGSVDRLLDAGALEYLTKPFDIDALLHLVDSGTPGAAEPTAYQPAHRHPATHQ